MKFPWLDELVKQGSVSEAAAVEIYGNCEELVKQAALDTKAVIDRIDNITSPQAKNMFMNAAALAAGAGMVSGISSWFSGKVDTAQNNSALAKTKKEVLSHAQFAKNQPKAEARFSEIAKIAPSVATNKELMLRLVAKSVETGLTNDDVHRLALLQSQYTPKMKQQLSMSKKASGETMADMYQLVKEAVGIPFKNNPAVRKAFKHYLQFSSIPLLAGVGAGAFNQASASIKKKKTEAQMRETFEKAVSSSDALRHNRAKAQEVFQSLAHFAPHVALEPQAARGFMEKLVAYDSGLQTGDLKDLTTIELNMKSHAPAQPFLHGLGQGSHALGLGNLSAGMMRGVSDEVMKNDARNIAAELGD